MRKPSPAKAPVDPKRFKRWTNDFGAYRYPVTRSTIDSWRLQFTKKDQDLAARVLDAIDFYGQDRIASMFRTALGSLHGWHTNAANRAGRWRFAALSGSAGESGDSMLYQFRLANNLDNKACNELFISRSEIFAQKLSAEDTLVLLDDFSGTGGQACEAWANPQTGFGELCAGVGSVYLIVIAAARTARQRINADTEMRLVAGHELNESDDIFSDHCKHFDDADRSRLLHYGEIADPKRPKGYGDCGFVVVFQHRCPNNSIPILHASHNKWTGVFPRHD